MSVDTIQGQWPTLKVTGEIDLANVDDLRTAIDHAIGESPTGFIIDLKDIVYIDSAGVAVIISAYRRMSKAGGILAVVKPVSDGVRRVLDLIGLRMLPSIIVTDDVAGAEEALSERGSKPSI